VPIDAAGELSGVKIDGSAGLAKAVRDDPAAASCVARREFAYAAGRSPDPNNPEWQRLEQQFKAGGYDLLALMHEISLSPLLYQVPAQNRAFQAGLDTAGGRK